MIEKFRKYTGLMFVALVAIVLGLIFLAQDSGLMSGRGRGAAVMKIHGRTYSFERLERFYRHSGPGQYVRSTEQCDCADGGRKRHRGNTTHHDQPIESHSSILSLKPACPP